MHDKKIQGLGCNVVSRAILRASVCVVCTVCYREDQVEGSDYLKFLSMLERDFAPVINGRSKHKRSL